MTAQTTKDLGQALATQLGVSDWCCGKGGFWLRRDGFYTIAQARRITGITAPKRPRRLYQQPYGDYATLVTLINARFGKQLEK